MDGQQFQEQPLNFTPVKTFLYHNSGYYLLAMLVERVTDQAYAEYLRQSVLAPLGLHSTTACDDVAIMRHRARGYEAASGQLPNAPFISLAPPKGGGNL